MTEHTDEIAGVARVRGYANGGNDPDEFQALLSEMRIGGSIVTYDHEVNAGYMNVWPEPDSCAVGRTVEIGDGINLDYATDGRLFGIERIGGPIDLWVLIKVLRAVLSARSGGES